MLPTLLSRETPTIEGRLTVDHLQATATMVQTARTMGLSDLALGS